MDIFTYHLDLGSKNKDENEIVASGSRQSTFCVKLAKGGVDPAIIEAFAKDKEFITKFRRNELRNKWLIRIEFQYTSP